MKTAVRVAAAVLLLVLLVPALAAACPLCKDAASNADQAGTSMWRGMYWSILLMVGMPFAMVGMLIVMIQRARRRREASLPRPRSPLPFPDSPGAPS